MQNRLVYTIGWALGLLSSLPALASEAVSFETIVDLVTNQNATTVESVLSSLPESYLENYTLMYSTKSIQGASFENPRAIVFGKNAKFILTFNGDIAQRGNERIEMIQFRDETKTFELRSITFRNGIAEISNKNPSMCLNCHGSNPAPIWNFSQQWPGAYGSNDDFLSETEHSSFQKYLQKVETHSRYKYLIRKPENNPVWPYRTIENANAGTRPNDLFNRLLLALMKI